MALEILQFTPDIEVAHLGPSFEKGPLPAVFYFALSARESLEIDPYNQPVCYLSPYDVRIFSFNLPSHGPNLHAVDAIKDWADEFDKGNNPITPFIEQVIFSIEILIKKRWILPEKIGLMGLSRGGLIASHVAIQFPDTRAVVGFAPMTELTYAGEFENIRETPAAQALNLENHLDLLCDKTIRFYIGNRDVLTGTEKCFQLVRNLAETAFHKGIRSPAIELVISPSIGHKGHGTAKKTFEAGADWLGRQIGCIP